jgi:hypothetical protein
MFDHYEMSVQLNAIDSKGSVTVKVDGICGAGTVAQGGLSVSKKIVGGNDEPLSYALGVKQLLSLDYFSKAD